MIECRVDRKTWYRGKGGKESRLLRDDGTRCCIGFLGKELKIPDDDMLQETELSHCSTRVGRTFSDDNDIAVTSAYNVNDDDTISDRERETELIVVGKDMGVNFIFEN